MKKYIILLLSLCVALPVYAEWTTENCTNRGGYIATGELNGKSFCVSKVKMNWWSANVWCQKHGGQLASATHVCPGTPLTEQRPCSNMHQGGCGTPKEVFMGGATTGWRIQ